MEKRDTRVVEEEVIERQQRDLHPGEMMMRRRRPRRCWIFRIVSRRRPRRYPRRRRHGYPQHLPYSREGGGKSIFRTGSPEQNQDCA